jgi:hypothetical protein
MHIPVQQPLDAGTVSLPVLCLVYSVDFHSFQPFAHPGLEKECQIFERDPVGRFRFRVPPIRNVHPSHRAARRSIVYTVCGYADY